MTNTSNLDCACRSRIKAYYRELIEDNPIDTILSEEDALAASGHGDAVYLEYTDWPATECSDRALDIAFEEKEKMMNEIALNNSLEPFERLSRR